MQKKKYMNTCAITDSKMWLSAILLKWVSCCVSLYLIITMLTSVTLVMGKCPSLSLVLCSFYVVRKSQLILFNKLVSPNLFILLSALPWQIEYETQCSAN